MSLEANKQLVRRWFEELNKRNLDAADQLYTSDYVLHDLGVPPDLPPGPEGLKLYTQSILAAIPDIQATIEHIVAEGDKVAVWVSFAGTHQGEFVGVPATGNQVRINVSSIIRIADGRIAEEWELADGLTLLQQIGAIPQMD